MRRATAKPWPMSWLGRIEPRFRGRAVATLPVQLAQERLVLLDVRVAALLAQLDLQRAVDVVYRREYLDPLPGEALLDAGHVGRKFRRPGSAGSRGVCSVRSLMGRLPVGT